MGCVSGVSQRTNPILDLIAAAAKPAVQSPAAALPTTDVQPTPTIDGDGDTDDGGFDATV
jgi:hypothetical protein